jgi:four helix bundle protein
MNKLKFEDLEIYQLAEKFSDRIWELVQKWDYVAKKTYGIQVIDSSASIASNLAEGYGKGSSSDRARFAKISRGSLYESIHWVNKVYRLKIISESEFRELSEVCDKLAPKLSAYLNYLNKK